MFTFSHGLAYYCVQSTVSFKIYKDTILLPTIPSFFTLTAFGYTVYTPPAPKTSHYGEYKIEITVTLPHG
jgi:hypothetical protein